MNKIGSNKTKQINDILSVVKLSSLLFSGMGFWEYFLNINKIIPEPNNLFYIEIIISSILILTLIYCTWAFTAVNKISKKNIHYVQTAENFIIVLIFFIVILVSGAHTSEFKFLFLFIIITTTIQSGMKQGMIIACFSSFCILAMDLYYAPNSAVNQYFQNDLIMAGIFILTAWPLGFYVKIANEHIEELKNLANEDGLTGLYNHRFFHDALKEKIISCEKNMTSISMIFIDIDYFKNYNDLYGHQSGDKVLRIIGGLLKNSGGKDDIVARYGGEEFAILLPDTSEKDAIIIAENIRKNVEETYFEGEENQPNGKITVSIGISVYPNKAKNDVELIKSADDALYRAKFFNKNRIETYTSILDELKKDIDEEHIDLVTSIKTLISVINAKDRYTYGHVERVVFYCKLLASKLKLSEEDKKNFIYGAYMHDIGKINISKDVLLKKMPLTKEEWEILKQHSADGVEIIKPVKSLNNLIPMILHHHERYDGKGYPANLKGEDIPYLARALTVVDSFDAMTSNRPYNKRKTYLEAIEELKKCRGSQFDPEIAAAFIEAIKENKDNLEI
ncbi:MAG: diguanylate cyclase [Clostridiaceae bacterium]